MSQKLEIAKDITVELFETSIQNNRVDSTNNQI